MPPMFPIRGGPRAHPAGGPAPVPNMGGQRGHGGGIGSSSSSATARPASGKGKIGGKHIGIIHNVAGKRHRKIRKDCITGITKPNIRRLARRGGVKRISAMIYDDARGALKAYLERVLKDCVAYCDYRRAKTITVHDVIFSLRRMGRPIYGFDPETNRPLQKKHLSQAQAAGP